MRGLVSVLIVVLIALVIAGVLLPAGLKVRDAAARMSCNNNLRQLGSALHNFASANVDRFPQAAEPNPDLRPEQRLSWLVSVGPYLEATNLYVRMDRKKGWDDDENRYLALTDLRTLQCPAFPNRPPSSTFAPTHYVGVAGLGADAITLPLENPRAGFFGYERKLTLADIEGHTSTLLAAIETSHAEGAWTAAGWPTVRGLEDDSPYLGSAGQFGGTHRGGANALFADGSVRFLRGAIDPVVFRACATIRGSKEAPAVGEE